MLRRVRTQIGAGRVKAHSKPLRGLVRRSSPGSSGQSMVEFAMVAVVAMFVLFVSIQLAVIGQCALAVSQLSYNVARWASVQIPPATQTGVNGYWPTIVAPSINDGTKLSVNLTTLCSGKGTPVTISTSFDLSKKYFLPNPFLGIQLPQTVKSHETAFCEGAT